MMKTTKEHLKAFGKITVIDLINTEKVFIVEIKKDKHRHDPQSLIALIFTLCTPNQQFYINTSFFPSLRKVKSEELKTKGEPGYVAISTKPPHIKTNVFCYNMATSSLHQVAKKNTDTEAEYQEKRTLLDDYATHNKFITCVSYNLKDVRQRLLCTSPEAINCRSIFQSILHNVVDIFTSRILGETSHDIEIKKHEQHVILNDGVYVNGELMFVLAQFKAIILQRNGPRVVYRGQGLYAFLAAIQMKIFNVTRSKHHQTQTQNYPFKLKLQREILFQNQIGPTKKDGRRPKERYILFDFVEFVADDDDGCDDKILSLKQDIKNIDICYLDVFGFDPRFINLWALKNVQYNPLNSKITILSVQSMESCLTLVRYCRQHEICLNIKLKPKYGCCEIDRTYKTKQDFLRARSQLGSILGNTPARMDKSLKLVFDDIAPYKFYYSQGEKHDILTVSINATPKFLYELLLVALVEIITKTSCVRAIQRNEETIQVALSLEDQIMIQVPSYGKKSRTLADDRTKAYFAMLEQDKTYCEELVKAKECAEQAKRLCGDFAPYNHRWWRDPARCFVRFSDHLQIRIHEKVEIQETQPLA